MKAVVRISDNKVQTIIKVPPADWPVPDGFVLVDIEDLPPAYERIEQKIPVPQEIAAWRMKAVVELAGLKPAVDAALDALPAQDAIVAKLAWYEGSTIRRDSPLLGQMAAGLGLTSTQVDDLFIQAAAIPV